ncbi:methyltransferase domain-containing protein [Streptomyces sp. NPDC017529]|uniref:methyltransferase domain-containing protein n=1 Tax=Streptomyces sp. NPDC017529 TaxID=3365000 RepID=UPI0037972B3C
MDSLDLRRQCAEEITQRYGYFDGRTWLREAFESVPRELFVPDLVWWPHKGQDGRYPVLDRTRRPGQWLEAVYQPRAALITQIADGAVKPEDGPTDHHDFTSSISCPAVVINMLRHLDPQPGERVLEIGTGTGYSAALPARRVAHIVTMEIEDELAQRAGSKLRDAGCDNVEVRAGDGENGWEPGAPYDRIISTVGVREIPTAWLHQVRPGGIILTPIDTPLHCDALLCLDDCDGRGYGRGRLITDIYFMKLRSQRQRRPWHEYGWPRFPDWEVTVHPENGQRVRTRPGF